MPKPKPFAVGPFTKGLNAAIAPHLIAPDEAADNASCDYSRGSIRGIYGPGANVATTTAGHNFLYWVGKNAWRSSAFKDSAMNDAPVSGSGVTYVTQKTSLTAATNPLEVRGASSFRLGVAPPAAAPAVVGDTTSGTGTSKTVYAAYTFVTSEGLESNPSPTGFTTSNRNNYTATVGTSADPRVVSCRLYRDSNGQLYFMADVALNGTFNINFDVAPDLTRPLNWNSGGNARSTALPYDHSPAPNLTLLSDSIHAPNPGGGGPGAGIIFGAVDNVVRWSMLGYAHYWPTVNALPLEETVEAILTAKTTTYVFTDSRVVAFSGFSDSGLSTQDVASQGILTGCGKTAVETPWGIVWLAREGVVIFAGGEPQVISRMLRPEDLVTGGYAFGAYFDHAYYLFGASNTLVFDMRDFPNVRVSKSSVVATAAHVTQFNPTGGSQGLYVLSGTGIKPWRPIDATGVAGASKQPWSHTSGLLCASKPHGLLRLNWCRPYGSGAVNLTFYDHSGAQVHATTFADLSLATTYRLPGSWARGFSWKAESLDGTGELLGMSLPAEEANGR